MSKRYVIQVLETVNGDNGKVIANVGEWKNLQHPKGGDWMTRSRSTAIADAAKLVYDGETRELRIGISKPVYAVTPEIDMEQILAAKATINWASADDVDEVDENEEEDVEYDGDGDDEVDSDATIAFELVDEPGDDGNAHNNN